MAAIEAIMDTTNPMSVAFGANGNIIRQAKAGIASGTNFCAMPRNAGISSPSISRTPVRSTVSPAPNVSPCIKPNTIPLAAAPFPAPAGGGGAPRGAAPADLECGEPFCIHAGNTLLATGGIGGVYQHSTNYPQLTGDACFLASAYGIKQEHLEYVQIHPTGLYSAEPGRTFLVSESCRGEGAILLNHAQERFTDELQPRDVVARAIQDEMRKEGTEYEWLSFAPVDPQVVTAHFANIHAHCLEKGRDILAEPIPVVPTQHYFMGGVHVDRDSATSMPHLYAAGETACNGVHGKNRLASNSLLESLVFARRAAWKMATGESLPVEETGAPALDGVHRAPCDLFPGLPSFELNIDTLI